MDGTRRISKSLLWRNKVERHAACTKSSSETLEPEGDCISLNLIGGYSVQPSGTNKKASTTHNHSMAERKQVSVNPASKLSGTKCTKVREASVRTNFQGLMRISPVMVERNNTTLKDQVKRTTERRVTNTNGFNVKPAKTKQIGANPISKFPRTKHVQAKETVVNTNLQNSAGTSVMRNKMQKRENTTSYSQEENSTAKRQTYTYGLNLKSAETKQVGASLHSGTKHMEVKESPVRRNVQNPMKIIPVIMEWRKTTVYIQEKKTAAWKQPMQSSEQNETEGLSKKRKKLALSSYMRYRKSSTDQKTFNSKKKMLEQSKRSMSLPHNLSLLTKMQLFNGGLPNVGNSCYVNASLQCLFTAEAFCEELSHLLDNSFQNNMNSFLRCFVNLSKLRKTSKVQGVIGKDCLLLVLIALAEDINPEFTIGKQSDAHEFLCHCLTQIEEFGRGLGWKEDSEPKCPVRSNFKFIMRNIIKCSSCGYEQKNKVEEFKHISLPLEHNSVDQCLHDIVNKPTFVESKCEFCGGKSASSSLTFHTLPRFLILQLNRFRITEDYTVVKQQIFMDIQTQLHINCFPQSDATRIEDIKAEARHADRNNLSGSATTYQLISVLSHVGSSTFCGHYVSDCSSPSVNHLEWMTYNDNLVTLTTEAKVLKRRSSSAYVLLYEKVHTIKENTKNF